MAGQVLVQTFADGRELAAHAAADVEHQRHRQRRVDVAREQGDLLRRAVLGYGEVFLVQTEDRLAVGVRDRRDDPDDFGFCAERGALRRRQNGRREDEDGDDPQIIV